MSECVNVKVRDLLLMLLLLWCMHQHSPCNDVSSVRCGILRIVGKLPAKLHPVPRLQKQLISPTSPRSVSLYSTLTLTLQWHLTTAMSQNLDYEYAHVVLRNLLEIKHSSIKKLQTWSISLNLVRTFTKGLLSLLKTKKGIFDIYQKITLSWHSEKMNDANWNT